MSRILVVGIGMTLLAVAAQAYAATPNIAYKRPPTTDDEKAVAQVVETLFAKAHTDARAAAELYTQEAVIRWLFGPQNEKRVTQGRERIYGFISTGAGRIRSEEYRDLTINVAGDRAEAEGQVLYLTDVVVGRKGLQVLRVQEERSWKLRRDPEGWRIYDQETRNKTQGIQ